MKSYWTEEGTIIISDLAEEILAFAIGRMRREYNRPVIWYYTIATDFDLIATVCCEKEEKNFLFKRGEDGWNFVV